MPMTNRWVHGTYIVDGSIVGTALQGASLDWFAHGCLCDWEDTFLGVFATERIAQQKVEAWVLGRPRDHKARLVQANDHAGTILQQDAEIERLKSKLIASTEIIREFGVEIDRLKGIKPSGPAYFTKEQQDNMGIIADNEWLAKREANPEANPERQPK